MKFLRNKKLEHFMKNITVKTTSYTKLVETYQIESLGFLKLDMEGFEFPVLEECISLCSNKKICPLKIEFEGKWMHKINHTRMEKIFKHISIFYDCFKLKGIDMNYECNIE